MFRRAAAALLRARILADSGTIFGELGGVGLCGRSMTLKQALLWIGQKRRLSSEASFLVDSGLALAEVVFFEGAGFGAGGGGRFRGSWIYRWRWRCVLALLAGMLLAAAVECRLSAGGGRRFGAGALLVAGCFFAEADSAQTEAAWFGLSGAVCCWSFLDFGGFIVGKSRLKPQGTAAAARGMPR